MNTITATDSFSPQRLLLLTKRIFAFNKKTWLTGAVIVYGFLALIWFVPIFTAFQVWHGFQTGSLLSATTFFYSIGGLFITSSIFDQLHTPNTAFLELTLPATTFEKLLSSWLISSVLFSVTAIAGYFILITSIQLITTLIAPPQYSIELFNPFSNNIVNLVFTYFVYHSIFLLGSVYFKKNNFLKTLLVFILISVAFVFITGVLAFLQFEINIQISDLNNNVARLLSLMFMGLMYFFSYVRLKNRQVA